jgi:hypothetical protein
MVNRSHKRRSHKRRNHGRKNKKGGGSYSSAASYGEYINGNENAQYDRVFSTSGPYGNINGNTIIGAQGQNSQQTGLPNSQQLALIQKAGKSRRKRGGLLGTVINEAVVPFAILGMQQTYKRKKYGGKTHRRRHRR